MKKIAALVIALAFVPFFIYAEEASSTPETPVIEETAASTTPETGSEESSAATSSETTAPAAIEPAAEPETINVNLNLRHQSTLVYSGQVSLTKGSSISILDNSGQPRSLGATSALGALVTADALSPDFALSNISYYDSFDSLYLKCIDIVSISKNACDYWQYVVNANYPPMGADDYSLSDGDTVYFYFGSPRKLSLSSNTAEESSPVTVKAESYDYMNDVWIPLSGATIGVTKPNPSDPYSPTVLSTTVSGSDGTAELALGSGSYGIGLATDYYAFLEYLNVNPPAIKASAELSGASLGDAGTTTPENPIATTSVALSEATSTPMAPSVPATATSTPETEEIYITLDMPIEEFSKRYIAYSVAYNEFRATLAAAKPVPVPPPAPSSAPTAPTPLPSSQTAGVVNALGTSTATEKSGLIKRILNVFGF